VKEVSKKKVGTTKKTPKDTVIEAEQKKQDAESP